MYMQISKTEVLFHMIKIPPECQYGDNPELDQLGTTNHLLPTYRYQDEEVIDWIIENGIEYTTESTGEYTMRIIKFTNIEDSMAFKLRWL